MICKNLVRSQFLCADVIQKVLEMNENREAVRPAVSVCESQMVSYLCSFEPFPALLFAYLIESERVQEILNSLLVSKPPFLRIPSNSSLSSHNYRWEIRCFMKRLGFPCEVDVLPLLAHFLASNRIPYASHIHRSLKPDPRTPAVAFRECEAIVAFANDQPAMFRQIKGQLAHVIFAAGQDELLTKFGVSAFEVVGPAAVDACDVSKFVAVRPDSVFNHYCSYSAPKFLKVYQQMVTGKNPFPCQLPVEGGDRMATLGNMSLLTARHFVDVAVTATQNSFMMRDIGKVFDSLGEIGELREWIVLYVIEKRKHDTEYTSFVLNLMRNRLSEESLAGDLLRRMINDLDLLDRMKLFVGRVFQDEDIINNSMPSLLLTIMENLNTDLFIEFGNKPFWLISDNERVHDFGFVMGFFASCYVLSLIDLDESVNVEERLSKLEHLLITVSDHELLDTIITDLFSLLFLKDENGVFVFQASMVERILSVISIFAKDQQITRFLHQGMKKLQLSCLVTGDDRLESALIPTSLFLYQALARGDFQIAEQVGTVSEKLCALFSVYRDLWQRRTSGTTELFDPDPGDPNAVTVSAEVALSFSNENKAIEYVLAHSAKDDIISTLIRENRNKSDRMKCVKKGSIADKAMERLLNLSATSWKTGDFISERKPLFGGFFKYLDKLIPVLLGTLGSSVFSVTSIGHRKIIPKLLQRKMFAEAEEIARLFDKSLVEYVLAESSIDHSMIYHMIDLPLAIFLDKVLSGNEDERSNLTGVLSKYYDRKESNPQTIEEYDSLTQNGCPNTVLLDHFKNALAEGNNDSVIDISYRLTQKELQKSVDDFAKTCDAKKLSWLREVLLFTGCSDEMCERIAVLDKIAKKGLSPFPLKTCFDQLVTTRDIGLAQELFGSFRYDFDAKSIIRRHVLELLKSHSNVDVLLDICPGMRSEIIESLPTTYKTMIRKTEDECKRCPDVSFDPVQWLRDHLGNKDVVVSFLTTNLDVDCDIEFSRMMTEYLSSTDPLSSKAAKVHSLIRTFGCVFRSPEKLLYPICKQLFAFLEDIKVVDASSEQYATSETCWIRNVIREVKILYEQARIKSQIARSLSETCTCIICLADFTRCDFCARSGIRYSFRNFISKEAGETLCDICYKHDEISLAFNIAKAWRIRDFTLREKYALLCFSMGNYDEGIHHAPNRRGTTSRISSEQSAGFSSKVIDLFSHPFIYESEVIAAAQQSLDVDIFMPEFMGIHQSFDEPGTGITPSRSVLSSRLSEEREKEASRQLKPGSPRRVSFAPDFQIHVKKYVSTATVLLVPNTPHFYKRIEAIANGKLTCCPSLESTKMLRHFLKTTSKVSDQVSYFVASGNFEKAFKYLRKQPTEQARWTLFFETIFVQAYAYNQATRFKYRMKEVDPTLEQFFGRLLEKLLSYVMREKMMNVQLELELVLERMETAAMTAIKLAGTPDTGIRRMSKYLKMAHDALSFELKGQHKVKTRPKLFTERQIKSLMYEIELQRRFCEFCANTLKLQYCDLYVFGGQQETKESMVVCLFKALEFDLAVSIQEFYGLSCASIGKKLGDIWINESELQIKAFLEGLEAAVEPHTFQQLSFSMLTRFFSVFDSCDLTLSIIQTSIHDPDFKCRLLIQFLRLEDAFRIAKANRLTQLLPLIGRWARQLNMTPLTSEINSLLSRKI